MIAAISLPEKRRMFGITSSNLPTVLWMFGIVAGAIALFASSASAYLSNKEADQAKMQIAHLNVRAIEAQAQIESAKQAVEESHLEQERVKALVSWRELDEAQAETFLVALGNAPGEAVVAWHMGDVEATNFGAHIALALQRAGWKVSTAAQLYARNVLTGVQLSDSGAHPERDRLLRAFGAINIPTEVRSIPKPDFEVAYRVGDPQVIFVGSSPVRLTK
jgi:hypothetical protein